DARIADADDRVRVVIANGADALAATDAGVDRLAQTDKERFIEFGQSVANNGDLDDALGSSGRELHDVARRGKVLRRDSAVAGGEVFDLNRFAARRAEGDFESGHTCGAIDFSDHGVTHS